MIAAEKLYSILQDHEVSYFAGVPDSLLKSFCAFVTENVDRKNHVIAANEGAAVGLATGYHLATGKVPVVYMQNSGLGNIVNPLLSIADKEVYGIPILLVIGWRGQPGQKDEPQHVKQGRVTQAMLDAMEVPYSVLTKDVTENGASDMLGDLLAKARETNNPVALLVEKGSIDAYKSGGSSTEPSTALDMTREQAIEKVLAAAGDIPVVSTTGMPSREVFELRAAADLGHQRDFLTVGAMGHTSQIALGISSQLPNRKVLCLDGDGSVLMHMGSLGINGLIGESNFIHVILNNGAHDSVGGQPTIGFDIDFCSIASACGYKTVTTVSTMVELENKLSDFDEIVGPALIEIKILKGARSDLGRPTTTPNENKQNYMTFLQNEN